MATGKTTGTECSEPRWAPSICVFLSFAAASCPSIFALRHHVDHPFYAVLIKLFVASDVLSRATPWTTRSGFRNRDPGEPLLHWHRHSDGGVPQPAAGGQRLLPPLPLYHLRRPADAAKQLMKGLQDPCHEKTARAVDHGTSRHDYRRAAQGARSGEGL